LILSDCAVLWLAASHCFEDWNSEGNFKNQVEHCNNCFQSL